jgi:hypothetical protein
MTKHLTVSLIALMGLVMAGSATAQQDFKTPDDAVAALVLAARQNSADELLKLFGPDGSDLVSSGDAVADAQGRARFVVDYDDRHKIVREADDKAVLEIGLGFAFAIPMVRHEGLWHFDTAAGAQEIIDRRIGRDELDAIEICRSYVHAQQDFAARLAQQYRPIEYAQKFVSSTGRHDGLYWVARSDETESPLGPEMASARAEGYDGRHPIAGRQPYHGYLFRILTRQSQHATGGARDYIQDGHMTGGFALIAFPARYGDSGIMSFIVNQDGTIYQKNLGPNSEAVAKGMTTFDPDESWQPQ